MTIKTGLLGGFGLNSAIFTQNNDVIFAHVIVPTQDIKEIGNSISEVRPYPLFDGSIRIGFLNFSGCQKEVQIESRAVPAINAVEQVLLSTEVKNNSDIFNQYFLIEKFEGQTEEDVQAEIERIFFEKNMKALPIPMMDSWKEFFWKFVSKELVELDSYGNPPYRGFKLVITSIAALGSFIELSHASAEFKQFHKVVPKLECLLSTGDIRGFNLKEWAAFFKENFQTSDNFINKYSNDEQIALVRAFEVFGGSKKVVEKINVFHSTNIRGLSMMFRGERDKNKKQQWKRYLNSMLEDLPTDFFRKGIENFEMLLKDHIENLKQKNWQPIKTALNQIKYSDVDPEIFKIQSRLIELTGKNILSMADACGMASVSDSSFKTYEELYLETIDKAMTCAIQYPTIQKKNGKTSWELINMSDPRAWIVGLETHCCQHLGSCGGACVRYAAANPETSGIFRVEEKGKTIAQSFFWIEPSSETGEYVLVLDNIEFSGDGESGMRSSVIEAYKDFCLELGKYAKLFKIRSINVGTGYMEKFLADLSKVNAKGADYVSIPSTLGYSDARTQKQLATYNLSVNVPLDHKDYMKTMWKD